MTEKLEIFELPFESEIIAIPLDIYICTNQIQVSLSVYSFLGLNWIVDFTMNDNDYRIECYELFSNGKKAVILADSTYSFSNKAVYPCLRGDEEPLSIINISIDEAPYGCDITLVIGCEEDYNIKPDRTVIFEIHRSDNRTIDL